MFTGSLPLAARKLYWPLAGRRYPKFVVKPALAELDGFVRLLQSEGIAVRRPAIAEFSRPFQPRTGDLKVFARPARGTGCW